MVLTPRLSTLVFVLTAVGVFTAIVGITEFILNTVFHARVSPEFYHLTNIVDLQLVVVGGIAIGIGGTLKSLEARVARLESVQVPPDGRPATA